MVDYYEGLSFQHRPGAEIDYEFDWSDWLATGETIDSYTVTAETGLTVLSDAVIDSTKVRIIFRVDGDKGEKLDLACQITTTPSGLRPKKAVQIWVI